MADSLDILTKLSRGTKALMIVNEFTTRRMEAGDLAGVLRLIAPEVTEAAAVVDLVENELIAASYPKQTIEALLHGLMPNRRQLGPTPAGAGPVTTTRRVHSPFVVPFDDFSFKAPDATAPAAPAAQTPQVPAAEVPTTAIPAGERPQAAPRVKLPAPGRVPGPPGTAPAKPRPAVPKAEPKVKAKSARHPEAQKMPPTLSFQKDEDVFFGGAAQGMNIGEVQRAVKPNVLIADDDARVRMINKIKFEEAGYNVMEAGDGISAWKHIREGGLAGAVLDMKIPGYHGLEILSRMVDASIFIPVVICSAYDQLGDEFVVATYPKLKYLVKPVPPEQVVNAMGELIAAEA